jgi:hypothetical protein
MGAMRQTVPARAASRLGRDDRRIRVIAGAARLVRFVIPAGPKSLSCHPGRAQIPLLSSRSSANPLPVIPAEQSENRDRTPPRTHPVQRTRTDDLSVRSNCESIRAPGDEQSQPQHGSGDASAVDRAAKNEKRHSQGRMTMTTMRTGRLLALAAAAALLAAGPALAANGKATTYNGKAVKIGHGSAHTFVRTGEDGKIAAIGIAFTPGLLDGLPKPAKDAHHGDFPYPLPMPKKGPKTVVDHVVIDWEAIGHPPPGVYDVPHFDFHFYLVSPAERMKVSFKDENASGDPSQQPPAALLPVGYIVPPGTAVPQMGVHAINPKGDEFSGKPFTATFIYGYYNQALTFIEPMASLAFLKSKPSFTAPVMRPASYTKPGVYPSTYSVTYDAARKVYEVTLTDFR